MTQRVRRPRRFGCVVVATDFSFGGTRAVQRAASLPLEPGARLLLLHVLPPGLPGEARRNAVAAATTSLGAAATRARRTARASGNEGVEVTTKVVEGVADAEIVRHARVACADLVVLGRHGRRTVRDLFLGSTAHRVVRTADIPVLLVNSAGSMPYRRPLLALDLGDTSRLTASLLAQVVGGRAKEVRLIHAFEVPFEALRFPMMSQERLTEWGHKFRDEARARVAAFLEATGLQASPSVRPGAAARVIAEEARRWKADLLALGTHGRKGVERLLLGSVAERVLATAPCDILVARPMAEAGTEPCGETAAAAAGAR
jgi:nucleotide-binding universal stress UspA family protein